MPDTQLIEKNITEVMETAYIDYSMSVIVSRALPDARDGCKPVHRRILYAMLREGLLYNKPFDKCAGVVGEVLKNYHPHGDTSVYDTLVRMAQDWVMRYPLIVPQGNFGSIDNDPPAAYRYTECKLTALAEELLRNIDEDTVNFVPNYKESTTEPAVLPAALPNLLMNGSTGIAVGMTTNIPPHNLGELIDVICMLIENPDASISEILKIMPGPDFPGGGIIMGREGIHKYMTTGRGIIKIRGETEVEEVEGGRERIIIKSVPFNVNRAAMFIKIASLVQDKRVEGITDMRDESTETTRIVLELKRGTIPRVVINKLYKDSQLETSFGTILLALTKRRPKEMNIKEMLQCYIEHRREVTYRRTQFRLKKAKDRAHILEGYKIAQDHLDDVVKIIRASSNRNEAKKVLMDKYPLSERQTDAILELRLYQLTSMERDKIEQEYQELMKVIGELESILGDEHLLRNLIKEELLALRTKYDNPRRTQIIEAEGELCMEDLVANEGCIITITHQGFIKRTFASAYRSQRRGGKGVIGAGSHDDDYVQHLFSASMHDSVLVFMNNGRVYVDKVYSLPEGSRIAKGRSIVNVFNLLKGEKVAAMICVPEFSQDKNLVLCTRCGVVKKTNLAAYKNVRKGGIIGIKIDEGDELCKVQLTEGENELVIITRKGMSIRFPETELRDQGRATRGVRGIALKHKGDAVETMEVVDAKSSLLVAGENGLGKRSKFDSYRLQGRAGSGVIAMKTKCVAGALSVYEEDEIMLLTQSGQTVRIPVKGIRVIGRTTSGVKLINLQKGDKLIGITKVIEGEKADEFVQEGSQSTLPLE